MNPGSAGLAQAPLLTAGLTAAAVACAVPAAQRLGPRQHVRNATGLVVVLAAAGLAVLVLTQRSQRVLLVSIAGGAVWAVTRLVAAARDARREEASRVLVMDYCEALLGELSAGQPVVRALHRSVEVWPAAESVAAAATVGADVPGAFHRLAEEVPGAEPLHRLAVAWQLCSSTGAGLTFALSRVLDTTRDQLTLDRLVESELASARATARLVAVLPVVILAAAQGIGARPWQFLIETLAGTLCLGFGVASAFLGLMWIDRIAASARRG